MQGPSKAAGMSWSHMQPATCTVGCKSSHDERIATGVLVVEQNDVTNAKGGDASVARTG